jgi:hypothetical protein
MIRIDAIPSGNFTAFEIRLDDELVLATMDAIEAAQRLLDMDVEDPMALVKSAVQWAPSRLEPASSGADDVVVLSGRSDSREWRFGFPAANASRTSSTLQASRTTSRAIIRAVFEVPPEESTLTSHSASLRSTDPTGASPQTTKSRTVPTR